MSASRAAALPRARTRRAVISPLTRLVLRRERRSILAWSLGGGALALYCVTMFNTMYATAEERRAAALSYSTPAAAVFTGPGFGMDAAAPTMGALFAAQALGWLALVAALMGVLMVIARTRGDEEGGPSELLRSAPVRRGGSARAALCSAALAALAMSVLCALCALAGGLEAAGCLVVGVGLFLVALVAAGSGLVLAALAPSARSARGGGLMLVLAWFLLRGLGDAGSAGSGSTGAASLLSWLTPIGLIQQSRVYVDLRWEPLGLLAGAAVVLIGAGLALHAGRELGEGLVTGAGAWRTQRRGPAGALGLALRTSAAARAWWVVGGLAFGLTYGIFAPSIESSFQQMVADNPAMQAFFGDQLSVQTYLAMIIRYGGILTAACAVALAGSAVGEEERGLTATVLSAPVSRRRWLAVRAVVATVGSATMLVAIALGLAASAVPALAAQDSPATARPWVLVGGLVAGLAAQLPAVLLTGAWLLALHAVVPRLARPLGWGAYLLALSISVLGPTARAPQWLLDLSPFTHVPQLPVPEAGTAGAGGAAGGARLLLGEGGPWVGPAVCLALAVALVAVADAAGRRRDLTA